MVVDPGDLSAECMLRITREMNYSETTFVQPDPSGNGGYEVRMFTPAKEIPFAGHPILGTAWVVRHHLAAGQPALIRLNLAVGPIEVIFETSASEGETAWFAAPPVEIGRVVEPAGIAEVFRLSLDDIDSAAPIQCFTAGITACLFPLVSLEALGRIRFDQFASDWLEREGLPRLVYFFCPETRHPENHVSARFFFFASGVREDPATGNAAAFLGVYLLEHRPKALVEAGLRIEQGHGLDRPSLVLLRAQGAGDSRRVHVGGQVIPILRGELL